MPEPLGVPNPAFQIPIDGVVRQTLNATPLILFEAPVGEMKVTLVEAYVVIAEHTFAFGAAVKLEALFVRVTGNIIQVASTSTTIIANTFATPVPTAAFALDQTNKRIQVVGTGKAAMTIQWWLYMTAYITR